MPDKNNITEPENQEAEILDKNIDETDENIDNSSEKEEKDDNDIVNESDADEIDLAKELIDAKQKIKDNFDSLLRAKAESENIRRRAKQDVANAHKFAIEGFVKELLPVFDSMELGLQALGNDENKDAEKIREGYDLTIKKFKDVFENFSVELIDPLGETFNPDQHQAISMQATEDKEPNTVIMVMQKGCILNERLMRPAMVVVSKAIE